MRKLFQVDRWILNPLWCVVAGFVFQFGVWYLLMPDLPTVPGAAPRHYSAEGVIRYVILFASLAIGIASARIVTSTGRGRSGSRERPLRAFDARRYQRMASVALLLSLAGEVVYVRPILRDPAVLRLLQWGTTSSIATVVRGQSVIGLSSLNNLFVVPVAVYALLAFHPSVPLAGQKRASRRLLVVGGWVLAHSLLLSARSWFVYYLAIVLAAYLISRPRGDARDARLIWLTVALALSVVWVAETVRGGLQYARLSGAGLLSREVQTRVFSRLVEGYVGADFNNGMVILASEPSMQLVSNSPLLKRVFTAFGVCFEGYSALADWSSGFGTVNALALWWYDAGWGAIVVSFYHGLWMGASYDLARRGSAVARFRSAPLFYLISYPGLFAITRVNYFASTIFLVPFAYLACWALVGRLVVAAVRAAAAPGCAPVPSPAHPGSSEVPYASDRSAR